jgi:hypothetical protein
MDETGPWAVSEPEPPSPKGGSDLAHARIRQCTQGSSPDNECRERNDGRRRISLRRCQAGLGLAAQSLRPSTLRQWIQAHPRIAHWLRPGGPLLAIVGAGPGAGTEENWLGGRAPMYWSQADLSTTLEWLDHAGLVLDWQRFVPEGDGGHVLIHARAARYHHVRHRPF